jgi:hypothetical protein
VKSSRHSRALITAVPVVVVVAAAAACFLLCVLQWRIGGAIAKNWVIEKVLKKRTSFFRSLLRTLMCCSPDDSVSASGRHSWVGAAGLLGLQTGARRSEGMNLAEIGGGPPWRSSLTALSELAGRPLAAVCS